MVELQAFDGDDKEMIELGEVRTSQLKRLALFPECFSSEPIIIALSFIFCCRQYSFIMISYFYKHVAPLSFTYQLRCPPHTTFNHTYVNDLSFHTQE